MRIGLFLEYKTGTVSNKKGENVLGEEVLALGLCKELEKLVEVESAEVYAPNYLPKEKLDVMIYMNYITPIREELADTNLCYIQNTYRFQGTKIIYKTALSNGYTKFLVFSKKIQKDLQKMGYKAYFFPFCINTDTYRPIEYDKNFDYDVAFVGNDIKGPKRTTRYLLPAVKFDFGLFGNWPNQYSKGGKTFKKVLAGLLDFDAVGMIMFIKYFIDMLFHRGLAYTKTLSEISKGKISQEDMIKLLSSSKISINFTMQGSVDLDVLNYRILEILACKGFVITDRVPIVEKLLKDCVVITNGGKDLENKIQYYLDNPEERKKIAENGYNYVMENFTAKAKAKELIEILKEL
jgi:spore maturation protein CgeB